MERRTKAKNNQGITLIALVISIIVMLILAGVSINALVGDNGVLTQTQYASFLNEMAAVEEAVQLWKTGKVIEANGAETTAIPTNGMCSLSTLEGTERLVGEIGFYRLWSIGGTMPTKERIDTDRPSDFNSAYETELVAYPAGVQDLYYLNNDALDIKGDKVYLIDASTGIIYSVKGIALKGIRCYSSTMAKAIMTGDITTPLFAAAEVSGSGSGVALAGNTQPEYLLNPDGTYKLDGDGNKIPNPDYNPNGFKIVAHHSNSNVYKLYNNGDLYGKGIKGPLLNTKVDELEDINANVYKQLTIPTEIPGASSGNVKVVLGNGVIYVIDSNKDLWAWGNNSGSNWLGLTKEQQVEYTRRSPVKLSFSGNVENVYPSALATYVVTKEGSNYKLYACGYNQEGQLGNGKIETYMSSFDEIPFPNPENIYKIYGEDSTGAKCSFIFCKNTREGKEYIDIYFAGNTTVYSWIRNAFAGTSYAGTTITNFVRINDGTLGVVEPKRMVSYYMLNMYDPKAICIDEDGKAYWYSVSGYSEITFDGSAGVTDKVAVGSPGVILIKRTLTSGDVQIWAYDRYSGSHFYTDYSPAHETLFLLNDYFPTGFDAKKLVDFDVNVDKSIFFMTNDGKVYASGNQASLGINSKISNPSASIVEVTPNLSFTPTGVFKSNMSSKYETNMGIAGLKDASGNIYLVNESNIVFRDNILQSSWKKIASNVQYFNAEQANNCMAYVDKNNDIWVIGSNPLNVGAGNETAPINEFKLLKSFYSTDSDTYKHLDKHVVKYKIASTCIFILTNKDDNNTLYCAGDYLSYGWTKYSYLGNGLDQVEKEPKKLLDNILDVEANSLERTALSYDSTTNKYTLYYWGRSDGNALISSSLTPVEWTGSSTFFADATDARLYQVSYDKNYIYMETDTDCKLAVCGRNSYGSVVNGLGYNSSGTYTPLVYDGQKKIKDFSILGGGQGGAFITVDNEIFGFGHKNILGMGTESTDRVETPTRLTMPSGANNPISIVCSAQGYIITTADGKVFGTGSNQYGTLGRWVGIDRNSPNSRYKTAFDWVECPELEI